jgi:hypothetical protein
VDLKRGLSAATLTALAGTFYPAAMVYLDWPGGAIRVHSGVGTISWSSQSWLGVMDYGGIEIPPEALSGVPGRTVLTLAVAATDVDTVMAADVRNIEAVIYSAVTTARGGATLVGEPFVMFSGYVDGIVEQFDAGGGNARTTIRLEVGSGPGMRSIGAVTHSEEDQKRRYPTDTIGRLLIRAQDKAIRTTW